MSDAAWLENLGVVLGGILGGLAAYPATLKRIRSGEMGLLVHHVGVELYRRADLVDLAAEELMAEIEVELEGRENQD